MDVPHGQHHRCPRHDQHHVPRRPDVRSRGRRSDCSRVPRRGRGDAPHPARTLALRRDRDQRHGADRRLAHRHLDHCRGSWWTGPAHCVRRPLDSTSRDSAPRDSLAADHRYRARLRCDPPWNALPYPALPYPGPPHRCSWCRGWRSSGSRSSGRHLLPTRGRPSSVRRNAHRRSHPTTAERYLHLRREHHRSCARRRLLPTGPRPGFALLTRDDHHRCSHARHASRCHLLVSGPSACLSSDLHEQSKHHRTRRMS